MINDIYVFIGENITDDHFKNFNYGQNYRVKSVDILPDSDTYGESGVVIFEDSKWGCLKIYFDKYFIKLEDFRNNKIKSIISDGRNSI
jgi:hypothetical protein